MKLLFLGLAIIMVAMKLAFGQSPWSPPGTGGNCRMEGQLRMTCTYQEPNGALYEMRCVRRSAQDQWACTRYRAY